MVETSFDYSTKNYSNIPAPVIQVIIVNPFYHKHKEVRVLVDTGYDGKMLIPFSLFKDLELFRYQLPGMRGPSLQQCKKLIYTFV
ncbi:MAG: hypothetical protein ACTSP4_14140 [Candidatus Hodarchaeales archaeon]